MISMDKLSGLFTELSDALNEAVPETRKLLESDEAKELPQDYKDYMSDLLKRAVNGEIHLGNVKKEVKRASKKAKKAVKKWD